MSTEPPAKRQRTEDDTDTTSNEDDSPQKSYLWFEDGNVVFQAEKTLFRVHKTVLALHSEFFADMFSICQPPSDDGSQPMFEVGCPLIWVSDSAEDLECLLSNIYENQKKYDLRQKIEVKRAVALYRLGNKYGIDYLRDEIEQRLKIAFPSTLREFEQIRGLKLVEGISPDLLQFIHDRKFLIHPFPHLLLKELILLANLAHQFNIKVVLPAIYATLSLFSNAVLLQFRDGKNTALNPEVLDTCLIGKEKLVFAIHKAISLRVGSCSPFRPCDRLPRCATTTSDILLRIGTTACHKEGIRCFSVDKFVDSSGVCEKCMKTVLTQDYEPIRQELWDKLPSYFGLPTWEELKSSTS
ncbi:hypothetical protein D9613_010941 [Agrocybe pediades]|uniref:BTB domain-containing protein n=1 Tax=Agrocybe pediades TaxID=84607 RepID=A0A8H4QLT3_9AGAR|nr:hypothetical protein D9613_010941 [Agrocybe pediades]KAF9554985.1 hypothetical protein CPC08DRAFT_671529 [Agrocybe pediades]